MARALFEKDHAGRDPAWFRPRILRWPLRALAECVGGIGFAGGILCAFALMFFGDPLEKQYGIPRRMMAIAAASVAMAAAVVGATAKARGYSLRRKEILTLYRRVTGRLMDVQFVRRRLPYARGQAFGYEVSANCEFEDGGRTVQAVTFVSPLTWSSERDAAEALKEKTRPDGTSEFAVDPEHSQEAFLLPLDGAVEKHMAWPVLITFGLAVPLWLSFLGMGGWSRISSAFSSQPQTTRDSAISAPARPSLESTPSATLARRSEPISSASTYRSSENPSTHFEQMVELLPEDVLLGLRTGDSKEAASKATQLLQDQMRGRSFDLKIKVDHVIRPDSPASQKHPILRAENVQFHKAGIPFVVVTHVQILPEHASAALRLKKGAQVHVRGEIGSAALFSFPNAASLQLTLSSVSLIE